MPWQEIQFIDTVWMLSYLNPADMDRYLAHRPAQGRESPGTVYHGDV
ncbi:MAG: hypothetical protein MUC88_22960 [Planctomycetes bacterium]|nr:hypothetical protein [Planctomycetota bacterium]